MFIEHPAAVEMMRVMRVIRRAVGGTVSLVMGIATVAAGLLVGAWTVVAVYRVELAWDAVVWVVQHVDAPWTVPSQKRRAMPAFKGCRRHF